MSTATRLRAVAAALLAPAVIVPLALTGTASAAEPVESTQFQVVNRAPRVGLETTNKTWAATPVDYDRDGDEDVWIGYHGRSGKLFRNRGDGTYRRVSTAAWPQFNSRGRTIDRHDCDWADVDRNGLPDAYCSTGRFIPNVIKHGRDNELWLQTRRGMFKEVGTAWGVGDECGRGRHIEFLDANGDRFPDLFLGNAKPREVADPCDRPRNRLPNEWSKIFVNERGKGFHYAPRMGRFGAGPGTECAETLDYDGDGWEDLLTCREKDQAPRLYRNRSGHGFTDVTWKHSLHRPLNDAVVADLDYDNDPDLVAASDRGFAYHLNVDGRFHPAVHVGSPGPGKSVAVGDAENDGDLDIYAAVGGSQRSNPDDVLYLNDAMSFTYVPVPSADGAADQAVALDPKGNGRAAFLVLNGFGRSLLGPVQFLRTVRLVAE